MPSAGFSRTTHFTGGLLCVHPVFLPEKSVTDTLTIHIRRTLFSSVSAHGLYSPWNSPGQNTGVGGLSLLQGIFPTRGRTRVSHIAGDSPPAEPAGKQCISHIGTKVLFRTSIKAALIGTRLRKALALKVRTVSLLQYSPTPPCLARSLLEFAGWESAYLFQVKKLKFASWVCFLGLPQQITTK